jgi:hypothetical protein
MLANKTRIKIAEFSCASWNSEILGCIFLGNSASFLYRGRGLFE